MWGEAQARKQRLRGLMVRMFQLNVSRALVSWREIIISRRRCLVHGARCMVNDALAGCMMRGVEACQLMPGLH